MHRRQIVLAGFSLTLAFLILNSFSYLPEILKTDFSGEKLAWLSIGCQVAAFVIPTFLLLLFRRKGFAVRLRLGGFPISSIPFLASFSLAISIASFLANYAVAAFFAHGTGSSINFSDAPGYLVWIASILVPALCEELFMRGAFFSALERCGTAAAMLASGIAFAMAHGSLANFAGPLLAGIAYAYMTYSFDSIWPAVFAHALNNWLALFLGNLMQTYDTLGLWSYLLAFSVLLCLLILAIALRLLERLLAKGEIRPFERGKNGFLVSVLQSFFSPGFVIFFILFSLKTILPL